MPVKVKILKKMTDTIKNLLSFLSVTGLFLTIFLNWNTFPDKIPGHYNAAGEIDRWGNKWELLILPICLLFIYALISMLSRYPQIWNTGVTVTDHNREQVYSVLYSMIVTIKLIMAATFAYLSLCQISFIDLSAWLLPIELIILFAVLAFYIMKLNKLK